MDYEAIVRDKQSINKRRLDVNSRMEAQSKKAQKVYDKMDATISDLGTK